MSKRPRCDSTEDDTIILYGLNDHNSKKWNKFTKDEIKERLYFFDNFGKNRHDEIEYSILLEKYTNHCIATKLPINSEHIKEIFTWFNKNRDREDDFNKDRKNAKFFVLRLLYDPSFEIFKETINKIKKIFVLIQLNNEIILFKNRLGTYNIIQGRVDYNSSPMETAEKEINEESCKAISIDKTSCKILDIPYQFDRETHLYLFKIDDDTNNLKEKIIKYYKNNQRTLHFANFNYHETIDIQFIKLEEIPKCSFLTRTCREITNNYIRNTKLKDFSRNISIINTCNKKTDEDNISTLYFS